MNNLQGQPGELRMTIQITRAATGETETYELVGKATLEELDAVAHLVPAEGENE